MVLFRAQSTAAAALNKVPVKENKPKLELESRMNKNEVSVPPGIMS